MDSDLLVLEEDDSQAFNRLRAARQQEAERERNAVISMQKTHLQNRRIRTLLSLPFYGIYALILARVVFDALDSWSLREPHQVIVAITEPLLGLFSVGELDLGIPLNPAHLAALVVVIAVHLGAMVLVRLMTPTR